ncbi:MAG: DnaA regulatory inactivator Hda [Gammaproteobacteria bacterium]|nr:DnaA regulatory inactivator Hda [Gammaproteobacteria bacterium]
MSQIPQIALNIGSTQQASFKNYYANALDKELLLNLLKSAKGRGYRFIYFWGPKGSGRTHLLHACCSTAQKLKLTHFYLSFENINALTPNAFDNLEKLQLVCIDDIHLMANLLTWEEAFFDFFNRIQAGGRRLLVAGNAPPQQCGFQLPDLVSRLKSGLIFQIHPLSEKAKTEAMIRHAGEKGLELTKTVADFILNHYPRDMGSLFSILDRLDKASLQAKHKLTLPFIKKVLEI